jgi:hypothetical protein
MASGDTFQDPSLKQAILREAERVEVNPSLLASVEGLFADAEAPAPLPMPQARVSSPLARRSSHRNRFFLLAAAVVVAGLSIAFFTLRDTRSEWDQEYTISEARLWPAMASLHRPGVSTNPPTVAVADDLVLSGAGYQLVATREDTLVEVPCVVRDYRREDGTVFSVITTPAANLLHESPHTEEEEESYDERVGEIRIIGGIKGDYWICVAAPATVPEELFKDVLQRMPAVEK